MAALLRAAATRYPSEPLADALVLLGLDVYPLFSETLVGSTIFGIANNSLQRTVELSPRAYPVTLSPGRVRVIRCDRSSASVELREVWPFRSTSMPGIWLGAMGVCRANGTITLTRRLGVRRGLQPPVDAESGLRARGPKWGRAISHPRCSTVSR